MADNVTCAVIVVAVIACALCLAWLCAKVTNIERFLTRPEPPKDTTVEEALRELSEANDRGALLSQHISDQVDIAAELGHQNAQHRRGVARNLAASIGRADSENTGEPGAAADAGLRSDPNGDKENA